MIYGDYTGMMGKNMEATIQGLGSRVFPKLGLIFGGPHNKN